MQRKTIRKILNKKFNSWLDSIDDDTVKDLIKNSAIISGGCITSMLLNEKIKDFDVYFMDKETTKAVADYYVNMFNLKTQSRAKVIEEKDGRVKIFIESAGVAAENDEILHESFDDVYDVLVEDEKPEENKEEQKDYRPIFLTSNAITLSNKIQIVIRFYGNPEEIHSNYDFVHCMNYWASKDNNLVLKPEALESILTKTLIYKGSKYPLCSVIRTRKFIQRGWHINAGQYLKMLFQVSELNLTDINVLEDQLIGVDSAYFNILINALKSQKERNPGFKITSDYVSEIVDRIFN